MITAPENLTAVVLNIYVGRLQRPNRQWTRIFYWKAVATIVPFVGDLGILHLLQLVARSERRAHVPRDAAHRCGFWIQYITSGLTVLFVFAFVVVLMMRLRDPGLSILIESAHFRFQPRTPLTAFMSSAAEGLVGGREQRSSGECGGVFGVDGRGRLAPSGSSDAGVAAGNGRG
jgi:hypothetical protein